MRASLGSILRIGSRPVHIQIERDRIDPFEQRAMRLHPAWIEVVRHQLDAQFNAFQALDARNVSVMSFASTVLPISFVLLNMRDGNPPDSAVRWLMIAILAFLVTVGLFLRAATIDRLASRPHIPTLEGHILSNVDASLVERWIAEEYGRSIEENWSVLQRKARWVGLATLALCLEAVLLAGAAASAAGINWDRWVHLW